MLFQGKELRIGDKLVSKRWGEVEVVELFHSTFAARNFRDKDMSIPVEWHYDGAYVCFEADGIDATWPDVAEPMEPTLNAKLFEMIDVWMRALQPPKSTREAEYRHIWVSRAARAFDGFVHPASDPVADAAMAFKIADAFVNELRRRDKEGK